MTCSLTSQPWASRFRPCVCWPIMSLFAGLPGTRSAKVSKPSTASDEEVEDALADLPDVLDEGQEAPEPVEQHLRKRTRRHEEEEEDAEEETLLALEPAQLRRRPRHEDSDTDQPSKVEEHAAPDSIPPAAQVLQTQEQQDQVAAALKRLSSHISNPSKFSKASQLLRQLIDSGTLGRPHRALAFAAVQAVFSLQPGRHKHLVDPVNRREVMKLMGCIDGLCSSNYFNKAEKAQITDVYMPLGVLCNEMLTDDSFVFSKVIAKLRALVDQLPSQGEGSDTADETSAYMHVVNDGIGPRMGTTQATVEIQPEAQQPLPTKAQPAPPPSSQQHTGPDPDDPFGLGAMDADDDPFGLGALMNDKTPEPKPAPKPKPPKAPEPPSLAWSEIELLAARRHAVLMCVQHARTFHKHAWAQSSIELLAEYCWQQKARFSSAQHAELDELWVWVRQARATRKMGPSAKEINRDSTSFERARADWSRVAVSARGKVGSNGDAKASNWLG